MAEGLLNSDSDSNEENKILIEKDATAAFEAREFFANGQKL